MGFVESPSVFFGGGGCGVVFLAPFDHPCALKSGVSHLGKNPSLWGGTYLYGLCTFEKNIQKFRKLPEERGHPATIVPKYLSKVKFAYRKTAP